MHQLRAVQLLLGPLAMGRYGARMHRLLPLSLQNSLWFLLSGYLCSLPLGNSARSFSREPPRSFRWGTLGPLSLQGSPASPFSSCESLLTEHGQSVGRRQVSSGAIRYPRGFVSPGDPDSPWRVTGPRTICFYLQTFLPMPSFKKLLPSKPRASCSLVLAHCIRALLFCNAAGFQGRPGPQPPPALPRQNPS